MGFAARQPPPDDPREVIQRYAHGQIEREEMIAAVATWSYEQDFVPSHYWDDIGISPEGSFDSTVGRAFDDGLLSDEDYNAILDAMPDRSRPKKSAAEDDARATRRG